MTGLKIFACLKKHSSMFVNNSNCPYVGAIQGYEERFLLKCVLQSLCGAWLHLRNIELSATFLELADLLCVKLFRKPVGLLSIVFYQSTFTSEQSNSIVNGFEEKWGIPQCVGAIDGSHVPVCAPLLNHTD